MIVKCSNCKTLFTLDDTLVKTTGSKVRCSVCKNIFVIYPEGLGKDEKKQEEKKVPNNTKKEKKVSTRDIKINYLDSEDENDEIEDTQNIEEDIDQSNEENIEDENIEDEEIENEEVEDDIEDEEIENEEVEDDREDEEVENEETEDDNIEEKTDNENIDDEIEEETDNDEIEEETDDDNIDDEIEKETDDDEIEEETDDDNIEEDIEEEIDDDDIEKENKKIKDIYNEEKFEDEENFIEKEEDIEKDSNFEDDISDNPLDSIEKKLKSKKKKPFMAIFFTAIMVLINTLIIYYLHTSLINSGKKRTNIIEDIKLSENSNLLVDKNATIGNKIKTDLRKLLGKQENFPYILPIPSTINSIQIINKKIGYIKIVTGEIVNKSETTYNAIKIEGILSTKENTKVREEETICGNLLSQEELRNFSIDEFKKRLQDDKSNEAIEPLKPGDRRRFFIVFFNLPNKLTTYHISVKSGRALK